MKRLLSLLITALLCLSLGCVGFAAEGSVFNDVDASTETGQAIKKLAEAGVLSGDGNGSFRPNDGLTRAELCKVINLIFKYTAKDAEGFNDVPSEAWYYENVLIAKKAGYIQGYGDGSFGPNDRVTREQTCVILARLLGLKDNGTAVEINDEVSPWALPYVKLVVAHGYMKLEEGNTFRATQAINRGEFSQTYAPTLGTTGGNAAGSGAAIGGSTGSSGGGATGGGATGGTTGGTTGGSESGSGTGNESGSGTGNESGSGTGNESGSGTGNESGSGTGSESGSGTGNESGSGTTGGTTGGSTTTPTTPTTYTVTFKNGNETVKTLTNLKSGDTLSGKIPEAPSVDWGYTFNGWYSGSTEVTESTAVTGNMTVTAKTEAVTYTVTLMSEGSEFKTLSYKRGGTVPTLTTPTSESGYGFAGWYTEEDGQGDRVTKLTLSASTATERTLYAYWKDYTKDNADMVEKMQKVLDSVDLHYDSTFGDYPDDQTNVLDPIITCMQGAINRASSMLLTKQNIYDTYQTEIEKVKAYRATMNDEQWSNFMTRMGYISTDSEGALMALKGVLGLDDPE